MSNLILLFDDAVPSIKTIRYYPRSGMPGDTTYQNRMIGGLFQGSNIGPSTGYVTLATIINAPQENTWSQITLDFAQRYRWFRYLSPDNSFGNIAEIELSDPGGCKLTGIPFGLDPSYTDTPEARYTAAWDGDLSTFYDYAHPSGAYTGIEITGLALR